MKRRTLGVLALLAAGIDRAQGLAAVTADDNTNIIAARVAREVPAAGALAAALARVERHRQHAVGHPLALRLHDDGVAGLQRAEVIERRALAHPVARYREVAVLAGQLRARVVARAGEELLLLHPLDDGELVVLPKGRNVHLGKRVAELRCPTLAGVDPLFLQAGLHLVLHPVGGDIGPVGLVKSEEQQQHPGCEQQLAEHL